MKKVGVQVFIRVLTMAGKAQRIIWEQENPSRWQFNGKLISIS
jgi:hypothetical protein